MDVVRALTALVSAGLFCAALAWPCRADAEELTVNTDILVCNSLSDWKAWLLDLSKKPTGCSTNVSRGDKVYGPLERGKVTVKDAPTGKDYDRIFVQVKHRGRAVWIESIRIVEWEQPANFPELIFQIPYPKNPAFIFKGLQVKAAPNLISYDLQLYNDTQGVVLIQSIATLRQKKPEGTFEFECFHCTAAAGCRRELGAIKRDDAFHAAIKACPVK